MKKSDLLEIIKSGENSKVEFKSKEFHSDSLAKEIVAFANMQGGDIFIGISDDGVIEGIDSKVEERVINICRNNITPSIIPEITTLSVNKKRILKVSIPKGSHKPYKVKSSNKFYIRAGSLSIEPTNEELIRLFQDGSQLHFEVSSVHGCTVNSLDLYLFKTYLREYRQLDFEDTELESLLYNLQCINEDGVPTVAGMLFFGKNPARYLPQIGVELNCFAGFDTASEVIDTKTDDSVIPISAQNALQFIKYHQSVGASFDESTGNRIDKPQYEPFVMRELVINCFMHRDWSIFGQKIRINIFLDRIEIFSPGKLPNTLNLQRALSGISYYRNPIIAQMLKDYKLADRLGRGLQKVMRFYKEQGGSPPLFDVDGEYVRVVVYSKASHS